MILTRGILADGGDPQQVLAGLVERLPETLSRPCPIETVLDAAERFSSRIESQALSFELDAEARSELAAFCRRQALVAKLDRELGETPFSLRRIDYIQPHFEAWRPLGLVVHLTPANAPLLPFFAVLESLLVGNVNWLRPSSADTGLSACLLALLCACDTSGRLAEQIAVLPLDNEALPGLLAHADGVSAWGGETALQSVRGLLPVGCRWIEWGPRISFAYLVPQAVDSAALDALADEICRYDQLACSSPQGVWVDSETPEVLRHIGSGLAQALARRSPYWHEPAPDEGQASDVSVWQGIARLEQVFGGVAGEIWQGPSWRVVWQHRTDFEPSPLFRSVLLRPMPRARLVASLRPWRTRLQSCALVAPAHAVSELGDVLLNAGVSRIVPLGSMHDAYAGAPHDGVRALTRLARRVSCSLPAGTLPGHVALDRIAGAPAHLKQQPLMDKQAFQQGLQRDAQLFFKSGGSSGTPKLSGFSYRDYHRQMRAAADGLFAAGLDPSADRVMNLLYSGQLYGGLLSFFTVLDKMNAVHYPMGGPLDDDFSEIAQLVISERVNTLICMPSTVHQLFLREGARLREYGGVKKVLLGGEHMGAAQRQLLESCGVETIRSAVYGAVDAGPLGHGCSASPDGVFHLITDTQWLEIVERERDHPVAPGTAGRLVFTSRAREGQSVVRYDIGDLGRWVEGACGCGLASPRFELLGRHGQLLRVGSVFLQPSRLAERARVPVQFIVDYAASGRDRLCVYAEGHVSEVEMRLRGDEDLKVALDGALLECVVIASHAGQFQRGPSGKAPLVLDQRQSAQNL